MSIEVILAFAVFGLVGTALSPTMQLKFRVAYTLMNAVTISTMLIHLHGWL